MNKFRKVKFDSLYKIDSGISTKVEQAGKGSPFLSFSTIFNNFFIPKELKGLMHTTKLEQVKYSIKKGDIFLTRTSETTDELAMSCIALTDYPNATFSGFAKRLRPLKQDETDEKFMGFYLRSPYFRKIIQNNTIMTLRASFNETIFSYLELYLPDLENQKKIGQCLYALEEKIELNNKINSELESMIKTVYDYWFVQFDFPNEEGKPYKSSGGEMIWSEEMKREIPTGWEIKELRELVTNKKNKVEKEDVNVYSMIDLSVMPSNSFCLNNLNSSDLFETNLFYMKKYDVLFGAIRPYLFKAGFAPIEGVVTGTVYSFTPVLENNFNFLLLTLTSVTTFKHAIACSTGTKMPVIGIEDLLNLKVAFNENISSKFNDFVKIKELISKNILENKELTSLRNWLLPMLMNGQARVK